MTTARRLHYTYQQYLESLERSQLKLEYWDGAIYAMAGGTPAHAELSAMAAAVLRGALPESCRVFSSDLKVRVEAADLATFPDATVVCGQRASSPVDANAITNPTLLVEVTSASTEDTDRGDKLAQYQRLPSLKAVLLVSHREQRITVVARSGSGWEQRELRGSEALVLKDPPLKVDVAAFYRGVALEP